MKSIILTIMFTALFSGQAFTLSCIQPDAFLSANFMQEDNSNFTLFKGKVYLDELLGGSGYDNNPKPKKTTAQTKGINLVTGEPFNESITIQQVCMGPWCGHSRNMTFKGLIYLRQSEQGYALNLSPCGGSIFNELPKEEEAKLIQCIKAKNCERPEHY